MKRVKAARKHDPEAEHNDKGKGKRMKEKPSFGRRLTSRGHSVILRKDLVVQIFLIVLDISPLNALSS
jgi:hypothetical protein